VCPHSSDETEAILEGGVWSMDGAVFGVLVPDVVLQPSRFKMAR